MTAAQVKLVKKLSNTYHNLAGEESRLSNQYPLIVKRRAMIEGVMVFLLGFAFTHVHFIYLFDKEIITIVFAEAFYIMATLVYYFIITEALASYIEKDGT